MENKKVSIVVPVYNVEKYLKKCLDSIINQTYKNIEIICIDDGSPDNSIRILNFYSIKDNRIKIIRQKNQGLSQARNVGLDNATGEYIMFVDSDDWIELNMVEKMVKKMIKDSLDLVICEIFNEYDTLKFKIDKINRIKKVIELPVDGISYFKIVTQKTNLFTAFSWNKMYLLKKIRENKISFPTGKNYEDLLFVFKYLLNCNSVGVLTEPLYHYLKKRKGSITNIVTVKDVSDVMYTYKSLKEYISLIKKEEELLKEFQDYIFFWMTRAVLFKVSYLYNKTNREECDKILDLLKNNKEYHELCNSILKNSTNKKNKKIIKTLYFSNLLFVSIIKMNLLKNKIKNLIRG